MDSAVTLKGEYIRADAVQKIEVMADDAHNARERDQRFFQLQQIGEQQLMEFAKKRLADYKTPERILFLSDLPKGPTGKVQRRFVAEQLNPR